MCGGYGKVQGRTLENYCHNQKPTPSNKLLTGCPLYPTKPENIDTTLQIAVEVAEYFRELKELNLLPTLDDMTAYEFTCYKSAERAVRKVQNDKAKSEEDKQKSKANKFIEGDTDALKWK